MSIRAFTISRRFTEGGNLTVLPRDSPEYAIVENIVDRALAIVRSDRGRDALKSTAKEIVRGRWSRNQNCLYPSSDRHFRELSSVISIFLERLTFLFPNVVLENTPGEAAAVRYDWAPEGASLDDYDPMAKGKLSIHYIMIDELVKSGTRSSGSSRSLLFQLVISVTHEVCHFLTHFLTGEALNATPSELAPRGVSRGEAGYFFEKIVFGGIVDTYSKERDHDPYQAGVPYLFPDVSRENPGRRVSTNYIDEFVNERISLPIRTSSSAPRTTRSALRTRRSILMTTLREAEGYRLGEGQEMATGQSSASSVSRNRVIPSSSTTTYYYYTEGR